MPARKSFDQYQEKWQGSVALTSQSAGKQANGSVVKRGLLLTSVHCSRSMLSVRSPALSAPLLHNIRTYAISVQPSVIYDKKPSPRIYSEKKAVLYSRYARLLKTNTPLIFFQHDKINAPNFVKIRREIGIAAAKNVVAAPSLINPSPSPISPDVPTVPKFTVIRSSIFGVALREYAPVDQQACESIASEAGTGPLAVLSLPSLHPPQLNAILRALDRAMPRRKPPTPEEIAAKEAEKSGDPPNPGRRMKRQRPVFQPDLVVVGALIEGRVFKAEGLKEVAKLPTLDTLRAQIVGMLSSPAVQLAGVLSQASGGKLARTLEGLRKGLEDAEGSPPTSS